MSEAAGVTPSREEPPPLGSCSFCGFLAWVAVEEIDRRRVHRCGACGGAVGMVEKRKPAGRETRAPAKAKKA